MGGDELSPASIESSEVMDMVHRNKLSGLAAAAGMLVLILDGKTALSGASQGLELCIKAVIPSLFPFFVLSNLMLSGLSFSWLKIPGTWFGIPKGAETILLAGFLGGYPTGAQCIASAFQQNCLTERQANRMLAFCNNAGPAFLFGMIAPMFDRPLYPWLLWGIHVISAWLAAQLLPKDITSAAAPVSFPQQSMSASLQRSIRTMALVCGWIILFRILIAFIQRWILWYLPLEVQIGVCGMLELSNGCSMLQEIPSSGLRFLLCAGMLGFGGLCVTMQTVSVIGSLSIRDYLMGKWMQTGFSIFLSMLILLFLPDPIILSPLILIPVLLMTLLPLFLRSANKKAVAFPKELMYNTANQNKRRDIYAVSQKN